MNKIKNPEQLKEIIINFFTMKNINTVTSFNNSNCAYYIEFKINNEREYVKIYYRDGCKWECINDEFKKEIEKYLKLLIFC